jgi:hypothetical protein
VSKIEELPLVLGHVVAILPQVVPCTMKGRQETRPNNITSINKIEFAYKGSNMAIFQKNS